MAADDALNGGQSYSGAFKLFRQMETLKDAEKLVCVDSGQSDIAMEIR
jgi:hypothetical protein